MVTEILVALWSIKIMVRKYLSFENSVRVVLRVWVLLGAHRLFFA